MPIFRANDTLCAVAKFQADFAVAFLVFTAMLALWCYLGFALANYPCVKEKIARYQHILVPFLLMALGGWYSRKKSYIVHQEEAARNFLDACASLF